MVGYASVIAEPGHGERGDGAAYFPVFPYPSYRLLSDDDAAAIHSYLQSLPPVKNVVPNPLPPVAG